MGGSTGTMETLPATRDTRCCEERRLGLGGIVGVLDIEGRVVLLSPLILEARDEFGFVAREATEKADGDRVSGVSDCTGSDVKTPEKLGASLVVEAVT